MSDDGHLRLLGEATQTAASPKIVELGGAAIPVLDVRGATPALQPSSVESVSVKRERANFASIPSTASCKKGSSFLGLGSCIHYYKIGKLFSRAFTDILKLGIFSYLGLS